MYPTLPASATHFGATGAAGQSTSPSEAVFRTTSGCVFRCSAENPHFNVEELLCGQCSGKNVHVVEAKPLGARTGTAHTQMDILKLELPGEEIADYHCTADIRCVQRDNPHGFTGFFRDENLTRMAQRNEVACAYHRPDGRECGARVILSELPDHHLSCHNEQRAQRNSPAPLCNEPSAPALVPSAPALVPPAPALVQALQEAFGAIHFGVGYSPNVSRPSRVDVVNPYSVPRSGSDGAWIQKSVEDNKRDIDGNKANITELTRQMTDLIGINRRLDGSVTALTAEVASQRDYIAKLEQQQQFNSNGVLIWSIPNFGEAIKNARDDSNMACLYSEIFYSPKGCKLHAKVYPNGDGLGKDKQVSVFLTIMRSEMDNVISWPFRENVHMSVIGHNGDVLHSHEFGPDPHSSSFQRPSRDQNIASGIPLFLPLDGIETFLVEGALQLKVTVREKDRGAR